jgi:hypothetical protein
MVELVDTQDLKSCSRKRSAGSIPALSTLEQQIDTKPDISYQASLFWYSVAMRVFAFATREHLTKKHQSALLSTY